MRIKILSINVDNLLVDEKVTNKERLLTHLYFAEGEAQAKNYPVCIFPHHRGLD